MMSACGIQTSCRSLISAAISPSPKLRCRRRGAITALHSGLSQIGDPCGAVCLLWPRRTKRKYRFDCCVVDWVLIRICRISIDHVKYISSTYAERLSCVYSALSRLDTSYYCAVLSDQLSQYKPIPRPNFAPESS